MTTPLDDSPFTRRDGIQYEPFTYYPPPIVLDRAYKQALRRIGGLTPGGQSRLRIGWGMDIKIFWSGAERPRYVQSKRPRSVEWLNPETNLTEVTQTMEFWGDPCWIVEEWKPPEHFSVGEEPEAEWERNRYEYFYNSYSQKEGPEGPVWQLGDLQVTTHQAALAMARNGIDVNEVIAEGKLQPVVECTQVLLDIPIDKHGPFPRAGRYECLCRLPYGQNPSPFWLTVIEESLNRRTNRRFVSTDAEIADMMDQMQAQEDKYDAKLEAEIAEGLRLHAHRIWDPSPNKGGSGQSIAFLPGKEIEK